MQNIAPALAGADAMLMKDQRLELAPVM